LHGVGREKIHNHHPERSGLPLDQALPALAALAAAGSIGIVLAAAAFRALDPRFYATTTRRTHIRSSHRHNQPPWPG